MADAIQQQLTKLLMTRIAPRLSLKNPLRTRAIRGALKCLLIAFALAATAQRSAAADKLTPQAGSIWKGSFSYSDPDGPGSTFKIIFDTVAAKADPGACGFIGRMTEPRTNFGPADLTTLTATFIGIWIPKGNSYEISITKTYDYDHHTVEYHGTYGADSNTVNGIWRIGENYGRFTLTDVVLSGAGS